MRAEERQGMVENLFVGGGKIGALLRSHEWSQTPLGAVETWSDSLKTAVQILLTELDQIQMPEEVQREPALPLQDCIHTSALRQAAEADNFRVALFDALRLLTDANEIQTTAARILGEYLGASRVIYVEVLASGDEVIVHKNYTNGVAELSGRYRLEDFGRNLTDDHRAGQTVIVPDVANSPKYAEREKAMYRNIDIAAHLDVPLIKNDQFVALLAVHQATPHKWTDDEVKWVEETAEQTWAAVERARAEAALRESEAKYRTLFESIDQGFCICEMLFDDNGEPTDYRFLEVNAAFERLTGLEQVIGKTIRELVPNHEADWFEIYNRVLKTREPVRFEQQAIAMNRWFSINAFCIKEPQSNQFAVLFTNITEAKRIEAERKQVEVILRESEEQSRNIIESITDAFFALDWNWRFTYVNQTAYTLVNRTPGDLIGKIYWEEFPGVNDSAFEKMHRRVMRDRVAESLTEFYPDHNRWYEVRSYPAANGITMYFRNVTEQIQAEAALRASEEKSRNVLESISEAFFALDQDWRFTYINQSGEALLDRPPGDLIGKNFWEEYPGVAGSEFETIYRRAMRDRIPGALTAFYPDHDRTYDVRTYPAANGIAVYFNNVTAQIQAQESLRLSEARFRRIFESKMIGMGIWTRSGGIIDANDALLDIIGYTRQDLETGLLNWHDLTPPEQRWLDEQALAEIALNGTCSSYEKEYIHKQGQRIPILVGAAVFADTSDAGVFFTIDLTERKSAEAEREKLLQQEQAARAAAEQANRVKDEFLAVLSHELRSPLNPILGWTRLLQNGKLDVARQAEALKTIERNAKLQSQLIEDLLDISRIMQGKLTLTAAPVSLAFVISAAVETVTLAADAKNIQIILDLDPEVAPISGDAARLQQVIWNLLTNAVKFTANGGQVTVELRQFERLAQIRVIDTGTGISPQFLPYVFEYFRQEDGSTTRRFGGLGLGLAIVRQIVELHGGTVTAESGGEHQGATFIVQFPTLQQLTPLVLEPIQAQADSEKRLNNIQILLVDDDTDTREFQAFLLEQNGAKVIATASGLEALQALAQLIPDVIVSDIGMAQMDGYILMQQIRSRPPTQGGTIPAIALTAYAAEIDQKKALQAGFQMHITKPLDTEQFISAIVRVVLQKSLYFRKPY